MRGLVAHRRLAVQLALTVAVLTGLVFSATGLLVVRNQREQLTREVTLRMLSETRTLSVAASASLLRHDPELELHPLVKRALGEVDDLIDLVVIDAEGLYQGHQDLSMIGEAVSPLPSDVEVVYAQGGARVVQDDHFLYVERPIVHLGQEVGLLRATVGRKRIDDAVAASLQQMIGTGLSGIGLGVLLVFVIVTLRLRPLEPLRRGVVAIGRGELDTRVDVHDASELGLLAKHINLMAQSLEESQNERIRQERLDRELEIAQQIQTTLLPRRIPEVDGFDFAAHYTPALEVSGDYYDVFRREDGRVFFIVADVSGKGVPGLVVMAMTRVILRDLCRREKSPAEILRKANAILRDLTPRHMFVTLVLGVLDPDRGRITYASAGHCPPVHVGTQNRAASVAAGGKPLAMFDSAIFDRSIVEHSVDLEPGQSFVLYTDGLTESENDAGEQFGEARVEEVLGAAAGAGANPTVERIVEAESRHRGNRAAADDLTLLLVRRGAAEGVLV